MFARMNAGQFIIPALLAALCLLPAADPLAAAKPEVTVVAVPVPEKKPEPERYLDKAIDPATYIVGPGDRFLITFYGADTEPVEVEVLPEGVVAIPNVGEVRLGQVTLEEAKERISQQLQSKFRTRAVGVTLSRLRLFKVSVTGGVEEPGAVVVSASDRVSDAVTLAGGLVRKASQRNIRLVESGGDTVYADLAYFNATGCLDRNPYLHEGQVIFVPIVSDSLNTVEIYGAVNQADIFEFKRGDRISDLLYLGFGPAVDADLENAVLVRFSGDSQEKTSLKVDVGRILADTGCPENLILMPDDRLFLRAIAGYHRKEQVTVSGEVTYPGVYPIEDDCRTVNELIARAGGILETASLTEAQMVRQPRWFVGGRTSFDWLLELEPDKLDDFELQYLKTRSAGQARQVAIDFNKLVGENRLEFDVPLRNGDRI
ncbi:MAG: SLBB domain-containing protein, partial [candidate division Zixibacteria bacterium]|nr:SLBB domain-containing protein [candidate division Zixibacteria bacterium]